MPSKTRNMYAFFITQLHQGAVWVIERNMNILEGLPEAGDAATDCLRWLFLDLNSFFASCEQQAVPALRGLPIAVVPMMTDTTCAIAASYEAKAFGIKTGTLVREAKQMCPALKIVQARPKLYVAYHHKILEAIETLIPIDDIMSIDEVACRLDRVQREPENARQLALALKAVIRERVGVCLTSSIGIAPNKLLAKLASDMQKPDGLTFLPLNNLPQAIEHLDIQDIPGIGANMGARLRAAGIPDIPALWAADAGRLRAIWRGVTGARFHALLHGDDLPSPEHSRRSLGHQHVLPPEERRLDRATPVIRQLLVRAAQRLRDEGFYCQRLILDIKWVQDLGHYVQESRFRETQDTAFLLKNLLTLWHAAPPLKPLRIGITLAGLTPCDSHQPDLFDKRTPEALSVAVDKLNARYGNGTLAFGAYLPSMTSKIAFSRVPKMKEFE